MPSPQRKIRLLVVIVAIGMMVSLSLWNVSPQSAYMSFIQLYLPFLQNQAAYRNVSICCLIVTAPKYFLTRAKAVNNTWAPRCDRYYFISELANENLTTEQMNIAKQLPIAPISNITSGYGHLTQKSNQAFLFAYEHHLNDSEWFVKADDDTYLIVDHLKAFLREQNSSEPVTFGYNFKIIVPGGYHSGGASYVLSRESLRRFYQAHADPSSLCQKDGGSEDVEIATCLRTKGVYLGKSLDKHNRELFHPLTFLDHFRDPTAGWLKGYAENPPQANFNCCSDQSVSFHYISADEQYFMDFLLYRQRSPASSLSRPFNVLKSIVKPLE